MKRARPGYTLIELLFSMVIAMMVAGGIVMLLMSQIQLSATQNRNMLNQQDMRDVMKFMLDEIQLAGTSDASEPVVAASSQALSFIADVDGNDVDDQIDYYMENGVLMRRYTTMQGAAQFVAEDPLLDNVAVEFRYYALNDAVPAAVADITCVEVRLVLNTAADETQYTAAKLAPSSMAGRMTLRNKLL